MNRTTVGDRIVDGVFATLVDMLRDRDGPDTWKERRTDLLSLEFSLKLSLAVGPTRTTD